MNPILVEPHIQDPDQRRKPRNDAATGASAAGVRALSAQMVAFYFRAPVKAFFRTRVDYMKENGPSILRHPACYFMLSALMAGNSFQIKIAAFAGKCGGAKRVWPPAPPSITFMAGFAAGTIQSIVAAPLDALQVRLQTSEMLKGHYRSMWHYGHHKLKQIGLRGVFAGWSLSFLRDSFGYAVFFSSFEYVKSQAYYSFITWYYGSLRADHIPLLPAESSGRGYLRSNRIMH
ncbi:hypothetical protein N7470_000692 [Penicillium chermesinum]|nr:hypothetical protein N7470_000692 [Penicillium chermesinum]